MVVKGQNVMVEVQSGVDWLLYACGRSCSLDITTDFIEVSGPGSGKYREFLPTANSFTGSIDGVVNLNRPGMLTLADLRKKQLMHDKLRMKFTRTDEQGSYYSDEAYFFISSSTDQGTFNDVNTFSIELRGTGGITGVVSNMTILLDNDDVPILDSNDKYIYVNGPEVQVYP